VVLAFTAEASMKRFFGKRRATRSALGGLNTQPFGRLGALVFRLNNSDKLYWASLRAPTRIAGCALSLGPTATRWENVSSERRSASCFDYAGRQRRRHRRWIVEMNGGCADRMTISFSLCAVFAEYSKRTPGNPRLPGADASAIHGRTERSGCTAAEPYPLSRKTQDTGGSAAKPDKQKRTMT